MESASFNPGQKADVARNSRCIAYEGFCCIAAGDVLEVAQKTREVIERGGHEPIVVLDAETSEPVELDLRGSAEEVAIRYASSRQNGAGEPAAEKRGRGRPKLGVSAREVTLLPRHWEWLDEQPGGASAALRRLVEHARHSNEGKDRARRAQESVYRFMTALAGNLPSFEEALRAFYRDEDTRFDGLVEAWPKDVRDQLKKLVEEQRRLQDET